VVGHHNLPPEELEELRRQFPVHAGARDVLRAIRTGAVSNLHDIELASEVSPATRARWHRRGVRSALTVPMRRENEVVGAIGVSHREPGAFSPNQVELLKTFADQAVIAIENVRLFTELQTSNHELTTALDTQTATSDILRVISRSQTDVRPVFDAILASAIRLLNGYTGALTQARGRSDHARRTHEYRRCERRCREGGLPATAPLPRRAPPNHPRSRPVQRRRRSQRCAIGGT